jgi:HD-GYP domain-containing protein (c-di-GMP phosphodiesterase class II)
MEPHLIRTSGTIVKVHAVAHRTWEKALQRLDVRQHAAHEPTKHLLTLFRTGYHLCQVDSPDELMQNILNDTVTVLDAQRGSILLTDEATGQLELCKTSRSERAPRFRKWFSRTLVRRCYERSESFLCEDVSSEMAHDSTHSTARQNMASIICALLRTPRKKLGVLHLDRGPGQPPFSLADFSLADAIAASVSSGLESAQLLVQQRALFLHTVTALARAVEIRDQYTGNHTQRVTDYALMLAGELGLPPDEHRVIEMGTPLHDIGKIGIADAILRKPGRLTPDEIAQMQTHPQLGVALLENIPGLRPMLPIILHHHERWNGQGYPHRLGNQQIPHLARIVAVADAFDAMTSDRPYRPAMPLDRAFAELAQHAGSHFDPDCIQAFLRLRPHIEAQRQ